MHMGYRDALSIASAAVKAQWSFQSGKRGAVLIMHNPRQICLPPNLDLDSFFRIDKLIDKWLVTKTHVCPAYSMYLSDKCKCVLCWPVLVPC